MQCKHLAVILCSAGLAALTHPPAIWAQAAKDSLASQGGWDTGMTGILSESEFKALHELRGDAAPPAQGTMIEVAGSRAYLSLPENAQPPMPALVLIHEWWGLNEHIQHWSDRLAADGYATLAVDLYGGRVATTRDSAMSYMRSVDEDRALEILLAAHAFLAQDERIQATHRGSIGWCFGGGWSLRLALEAADLQAAVIYYGRLVTDPERLAAIRASILGIFGTRDTGIPQDVVETFDKALEEAEVEHRILRFDAEHAFANPSNANYDAEAAAAAWKEVRGFLASELKP